MILCRQKILNYIQQKNLLYSLAKPLHINSTSSSSVKKLLLTLISVEKSVYGSLKVK